MKRGENRLIHIDVEGGNPLLISEAHDSIQRFEDSSFDYLRYWDAENGQLTAIWLGAAALSELMAAGIPETMRSQFTDAEEEYYLLYQSKMLDVELSTFERGE